METIEAILAKAHSEGRKALSENEVYDLLDAAGLATPKRMLVPLDGVSSTAAVNFLASLPGARVVLKISSSKTLHKTESGGVKICSKEHASAEMAAMAAKFQDADGIMISEFVEHAVFSMGQELMLGARQDAAFGPLVSLGVGGTDAEAFTKVLKPGHSPSILAADMACRDKDLSSFINEAWIWRYVSGHVRGGKRLAPDAELLKWLNVFCALVRRFRDGSGSAFTIEEVEVNPLCVSGGRLVALDGVLRFRPSRPHAGRVQPSAAGVDALLKPQAVAVAGVSEKGMNMGRIILRNVVAAGFPVEKTWVLKDFSGTIEGARCFANPADFPAVVDMLVVAVPSPAVPQLLKDCAASGKVRGIVLISGGMGEKEGSEGVKDEVLAAIAEGKKKNPDLALSGGNSLGIVSNPSKVNTLFIPTEKLIPPLGHNPMMAGTAFISQSGAFVVATCGKLPWFKPVYSVTVGNQMDVTVVDYVERVTEDPAIRVVAAYMEGLKDGDGIRLAKACARAKADGKIVVAYKAGRTPTGQKAVMGHTASIAGDFVVARDILSRSGALVAETLDEFEDLLQTAAFCAGLKPKSGKAFILTNAGFEAAAMADNIHSGGALLPEAPSSALAAKIAAVLKEYRLDSIVDVKNPIDVTPMAQDGAILKIADAVMASGEYSSLIVSPVPLTPAMKTIPQEGLDNSVPVCLAELVRRYGIPAVFCVAAGPLYDPYCVLAQQNGLPVFRSADRAVRALTRLISA